MKLFFILLVSYHFTKCNFLLSCHKIHIINSHDFISFGASLSCIVVAKITNVATLFDYLSLV